MLSMRIGGRGPRRCEVAWCPAFEVDRKILKDVVREKLGVDVGRITFLSSGEQQKRIF